MDTRKRKNVYAIVEHDGRCWWRSVGVGVVNADGSIDVRLDGVSQSGALQVRDVEQRVTTHESGT